METMKRNYKNLAVSLLVGTAIFGSTYPATLNAITSADAYTVQNAASNTTSIAATSDPVITVKEASSLDLWLEKLAQLESHGQEHIKIMDVNGRYSYGCLQFQAQTFRNFGAKYGLVSLNANIEATIYDCTLQKAIAKHMIKDDYILWQSWYTSVVTKGLGLPPLH
jgi:hypothetical protein